MVPRPSSRPGPPSGTGAQNMTKRLAGLVELRRQAGRQAINKHPHRSITTLVVTEKKRAEEERKSGQGQPLRR